MSDNSAKVAKSQHDLVAALSNVADIVLAEQLNAIRSSIKALDEAMQKQIDALRKETVQMIQSVEEDVAKKLQELTNSVEHFGKLENEARNRFEASVGKSLMELRDWVTKSNDATRATIEQIKNAMEKELLAQQERIYNQFNSIEEHLEKHQDELLQRSRETRRISALMSNFARILTEVESEQPKVETAQKPQQQPARPKDPTETEVIAKVDKPVASSTQKHKKGMGEQKEAEFLVSGDNELPTSDDIGQSMDNIFQDGKKK